MAREERVERYIESYWLENWTSPSVQEIAAHVGFKSKSSAHRLLGNMVAAGRLEVKHIGTHRVFYRTRR